MKVKKLNFKQEKSWCSSYKEFTATAPIKWFKDDFDEFDLIYTIILDDSKYVLEIRIDEQIEEIGRYKTQKKAELLAQKHFEKIIMSAFEEEKNGLERPA